MKNNSKSPKGSQKRPRKKRKKKTRVSTRTAILAAGLLLMLAIAPAIIRNLVNGNGDSRGASIPSTSFNSLGIDISHNNPGPIVWDSLRVMTDKNGFTTKDLRLAKNIQAVKFVFIKATEGQSMKDPAFKKNWADAGKSGISRGAYHFFRSSKSGKVQAELFISTVGELRHIDLAPVLDIETMHKGCSVKTLNDRALEWLQTVEKHYDRKPIVYTSDHFAEKVLDKRITEKYTMWIAHYEVDKPDFKNWKYWQFTDKAVVYGVPGKVDLSVSR